MGLLDDAIRAHEDVFRKRGINPDDLIDSVSETSEREVVDSYLCNFGLDRSSGVGITQVVHHLNLESTIVGELLDSDADNRWEVFEKEYTKLYASLPWLVGSGQAGQHSRQWMRLVGAASPTIYEVGSGAGAAAEGLAALGCQVVATELTRERGERERVVPGVEWESTDGVNLERFAGGRMFDAVITDQVVEHLHPDDLDDHLRSAHSVLKSSGRYILRTPNVALGPSDISRVFGFAKSIGLHLREYSYTEMCELARGAGFSRVKAVLVVPTSRRGRRFIASSVYLRLVMAVESHAVKGRRIVDIKWPLRAFLRAPVIPRGLFLVLYK